MYRTNARLTRRPDNDIDTVNSCYLFKVTEVYSLENREIFPSYQLAVPFKDVTFIRHIITPEVDEWEPGIDDDVVNKIWQKGCNELWIWPLFGDFKCTEKK